MNRQGPAIAHVAVVLAAGGSRRLGRPKQLLKRGGETLVHRAVRLASESGAQQIFVVVGAEREAVTAALEDLACALADNPDWQQGLASSLAAVAPAAAACMAPVLVLGCDQPALEADHLQALVSGAISTSARCAATLHAGLPGIPAVVPAAWFADADALAGDAGFGQRLRALPPQSLFLLDAPELAFDLDTPGDVEAAIARGWIDAG